MPLGAPLNMTERKGRWGRGIEYLEYEKYEVRSIFCTSWSFGSTERVMRQGEH